jgi:hypothetical protein
MSTTAKTIIDNATIQLLDPSNTRWSRAELLTWINDAQKTLVGILPEATATIGLVTTVSGVKQALPTDGWCLLSVNRNMGVSGTTGGTPVLEVTREDLTRQNPTWSTDTAASAARLYFYTPLQKSVFWVYPPADATANKLEITYSKIPTDVVVETDTIAISDIYKPAILDYVLFKACSKDAEYAPGAELAKNYLASFTAFTSATKAGADVSDKIEDKV